MPSQALTLKIYLNDELVETKTLCEEVVKIGRLKGSHVRLKDDRVARMHAVIEATAGNVRVVDLGSATGTTLNEQPVDRSSALEHGDTLTFGSYRVEVSFVEATRSALEAMPGDAAGVEVHDGSRVAEVVTTYGSTVLDVEHVGQVRSKRGQAPLLLVMGGLMMVGGAALFAHEVGQDWEGYRQAVAETHELARPLPAAPGTGLGGLAVALALLGLVPFALGKIRLGDTGLCSFTIGEGHHATFAAPTAGLPDTAAFPLVRGEDRGHELSFTETMTGEVVLDGQRITLTELAISGRARREGSSYAFPLPPDARCRVQHGDLTFHVSSVLPGARMAGKRETDIPFWAYNAASFSVIGGIIGLTHLIPEEAQGLTVQDVVAESFFAGYLIHPDDTDRPQPTPAQESTKEEAGGTGVRHRGAEGKMGNPAAKQRTGLYAIKGPKDEIPQLARDFDPDMMARRSGILGVVAASSGHFLASLDGGPFAVGNDDVDVWGGLTGTEIGEAFGTGGLGLVGTGRGGGGIGAGTIGLGTVGRIGKGAGSGKGTGYGRGGGAGFGRRGRRGPPVVAVAKGDVSPGIDKEVIRRVVRAHLNEVRHCYNQGLVRDPNLMGRVAVQFSIGATGRVPVAVVHESSVQDRDVARCIAKAVQRWRFPRPRAAGHVMVTYPFVLSPG